MTDTTDAAERRASALLATLVDALGVAIAAARADGSACAATPTQVRLLDQWRAQLEALSPAAVESARLVVGLCVVFTLCDVRLVAEGEDRGVHIGGQAVGAFDAALRLIRFQDCLRGTSVGETAMAALLGGFIDEVPASAPPDRAVH